MHMNSRVTVLLAVIGAAVPPFLFGSESRGQEADSPAALVTRAGAYVREYDRKISAIVGEEHQIQRLVNAKGAVTKQRDLNSDILFVKAGRNTLVFRDVIAA